MNNQAVLSVHHLYAGVVVNSAYKNLIQDINFVLNKGETLALVGESGSGKSFTSLCLMGLLNPSHTRISQGEIKLWLHNENYVNLLNLNEKERQRIRGKDMAMIFQEPMSSLNPSMTCGKQVAEIIVQHQNISLKQALSEAEFLFEKVKLPRVKEMLNQYPHQLSGGQKQRVMIAMAIANKPKILIADEPTTALDVTVQKSVLDLLQQIKVEMGMSLLFITHDLGVVKQIADTVLVMQKGVVVEYAPAKHIFNAPVNSYTKGLLACKPSLRKRPLTLPTVSDFVKSNSVEIPLENIEDRKKAHIKLYQSKPILKVDNLTVEYPSKSSVNPTVKALDQISFEIFKGETFGLVGESGCGKSTLGRAVLGLIRKKTGNIIFEDEDISSYSGNQMRPLRKKMQLIFQDPFSSLNPRQTVGELLTEPLIVHFPDLSKEEMKKRVLNLMDKTGLLPEYYARYPHEFSGGQRQRIGIARTLILQPSFVICDESVSALDVSVQAQVLNLLNELKKEFGLTYIFISHDLSVVKYMCDRIMVMKQGKIIEIQEADTLIEKPLEEYTKTLINAIPVYET